MTIINPKSIAGVTSITTASGADNLLTVHTNNTTERVRINNDGDVIVGSGITVSPDGDIFTTGVTTATTFVGALTGNVTGNATGLSGTPNISAGTIAGSTGTFTGDVDIADKIVHTGDTDTAIRFSGADTIKLETSGTERFQVDSSGNIYVGGVGGSATAGTLWFNDTSANASKIAQSNGNSALTFHTGSSQPERARITSAGKIGIGLDSPNCLLHIQDAAISQGYSSQSSTLLVLEDSGDTSLEIAAGHNNTASIFFGDTGASQKGQINYLHGTGGDAMSFFSNGSEGMRINSDGDVLIGRTATIDTSEVLGIKGPSGDGCTFGITSDGTTQAGIIAFNDDDATFRGRLQYNHNDDSMRFNVSGTECARFMSSGFLKAKGNSASYHAETTGYHELIGDSANDVVAKLKHNSSTGYGLQTLFNHASSSIYALSVRDFSSGNTDKAFIRCDGDLENANNSYGGISDVKLKENIVDAESQWNDIKALKVRNFNFKIDENKTKLLGLIAQEAEAVCPSLVKSQPDLGADNEDLGTETKVLKYSIVYMKAVKALQESMARIEVLETRLNNAGIAT